MQLRLARRDRGLTLVELVVVVAVTTVIIAPFAVFFVQLVTMSRMSSEKLVLAGDNYASVSAVRNELIRASNAVVAANIITYTARDSSNTPVARTMALVGTDLTVVDAAGSRVIATDVAAFSATLVQPWQIEVTLTQVSRSNQTMGVTVTFQSMLLNASVGR